MPADATARQATPSRETTSKVMHVLWMQLDGRGREPDSISAEAKELYTSATQL